MNSERVARMLAAQLLCAVALAACSDSPAPAAAPPAVEVTTLVVRPRLVPVSPEYVGQTESSQQVEVRARVSGFLDKRIFTEGATVKAGQPLFSMDRKPFEAALQAARAEAAAQKARLDVARQNLARVQPLAEQNALSQKDLDDAIGQEKSATAAVEAAAAKVIEAELNLGYTTIVAPVTGLSSFAKLQEGSYVDVSNSLLTYVAKLDPMRVNFSLSENEILRFRDEVARGVVKAPPAEAFEVEIVLADGSVFPARGKLTFSDVAFSQDTGTFLVRAELPNPQGSLRPGQFVRVRLIGAMRPGSYVVPQRAVQQGPRGAYVWIASQEGKAEQRAVETGTWVGDDWLITNGLRPDEAVIVDGTLKLAPGVPVKVIKTLEASQVPAPVPAASGKTTPALQAAEKLVQSGASGLPTSVQFASGNAVMPTAEAGRLAQVAAYLAANPNAQVAITGHTDRRGGAAANAALAKARAEGVRSALLVGGAREAQVQLRAPASVIGSGADDIARRVEVVAVGTP